MYLSQAIILRLVADATLTALVDNGASSALKPRYRLYWGARPQGSPLPALLMQVVSSVPEETLEGEDPDLWTSRVQLAAMARSHADASALARLPSAVLLPGAVVGDPGDEMEFELGQRLGPRDTGEPDEKGFIHAALTDVILRHSAGS
jgi:hypothetical protein